MFIEDFPLPRQPDYTRGLQHGLDQREEKLFAKLNLAMEQSPCLIPVELPEGNCGVHR